MLLLAVRLGKCGGFYLRSFWDSGYVPLTEDLRGRSPRRWAGAPQVYLYKGAEGACSLRPGCSETDEKAATPPEKTIPQALQPEKVASLSRRREGRVESGRRVSPIYVFKCFKKG